MKENNSRNTLKKSVIRITLITILILMVPLVAMQFSDEVDWKVTDFIIIGSLLMATGLSFEWVSRRVRSTPQRIFLGIAFLMVLLLIWAELAVGIFGTPFAGS